MGRRDVRAGLGFAAAAIFLVHGFGAPLGAQERLRPIPPDQMSAAQKQAVAEFNEARKGNLAGGVYMTMLRTPGVLSKLHPISLHLNSYECAPLPPEKKLACLNGSKADKNVLGDRLTQFAIAITLVERNVQNELVHFRLAEHFGVSPATLKAVVAKRRPAQMPEDEGVLYDFLTAMLRNYSVSDAVYAKALAKFGEPGIVDILNAGAFYSMVGLMQNVAVSPGKIASPAPEELR